MLKSSLFILLFFLFSPFSFISDGIHFYEGNWNDLLKKAKSENKIIFIDTYTSWCGPCKKMSKETFTNDTIGEFFNKNFISYKIDIEKGEGPMIKELFGITVVPTLVFLDPDKKVIVKTIGYQSAKNLLALGKKSLLANKSIVDFKNEFDKVKFSHADSLLEIAFLNLYQGLETKESTAKYFETQSDTSLHSEKNIKANFYLEEDLTCREMTYFLTHQQNFSKYFSKEAINNKVYRVLRKNVELAIKQGIHINDFCENFVKFDMPLASELSRVSKVIYYERTQNWEQFAETSLFCFEHNNADMRFANNICWNFYLHVSDTAKLNKAESYLSKNLNSNPRVYDTYAALLFKNGKTNLAIKAAKEAISISKKKDEDFSESTVLLEKIKGKK